VSGGTLVGMRGLDGAVLAATLMTLALAWRPARAEPATASDDAARLPLREAARSVLLGRCLPCHSRSTPGANPRALAIYDLDELEWPRHMTASRFEGMLRRLSSAAPAQLAAVRALAAIEARRGPAEDGTSAAWAAAAR
jgi:hypothetical protein